MMLHTDLETWNAVQTLLMSVFTASRNACAIFWTVSMQTDEKV